MPLRVLFINTINPYEEIEYRYPPLGIGYLISSLKKHFKSEAFEFKVINDNVKYILSKFQPHIVGITSVTQNYTLAKEYATLVKSTGTPVIVGGIHISLMPSSLTADMDIGVIGEGERAIVDIFELFIKKGKLLEEDFRNIKGIVFRDSQGNLVATEAREPVLALDTIAIPDRDLFNIRGHSYLFTSRGCPYACFFCASTRFWKGVRFFSAEYVLQEIKVLVEKYSVRLISFYDDLMIADKARLKRLVLLLQKESILKEVRFSLNARANLLNEEVVRLLKAMNVVSVGMGLESGNDRVLRYLKGGNISVSDNRMAIANLRRQRIAANASFVIGSPDETRDEIMDTYNFIKKSGLSFFDTYALTPFPGTPAWEYALKTGVVSNDMDWSKLNVNFGMHYKSAVIVSQALTREELYTIFKKFQRLRLIVALKHILWHPLLFDICGLLIENFVSKCKRLIKAGDKA
jgi:radical SAM superfamily enzyme YgiQ (UPF0313 family)